MADNMGQGKIPWYRHRLMHRKIVTCELHDSYFRLMTIKHAIPKIEWAIELLYNSVKTGSQLVGGQMSKRQDVVEKATNRQKGPLGPPIEFGDQRRWWQDVVEKATIQQKGPSGPPSEFGDQLVRRCWDENISQRDWALRPPGWAALENEKDTTLMAIKVGVNILQFWSVSNSFSHTPTF